MDRCNRTIDWLRGHCDERWRQSEEYEARIERAVKRAMSKSGAYGGDDGNS